MRVKSIPQRHYTYDSKEVADELNKIEKHQSETKRNKAKSQRKNQARLQHLLATDKMQISNAAMKRLICEIAQDLVRENTTSKRKKNKRMQDKDRENEGNEEIVNNEQTNHRPLPVRFQKEAYDALHHAGEAYVVDILHSASALSRFRGRKEIIPADVRLADQIFQGRVNQGPLTFDNLTGEGSCMPKK